MMLHKSDQTHFPKHFAPAVVVNAICLFLMFLCLSGVQSVTEPTFTLPHRGCYYAAWSTYRVGKARFLPRHIDASLCTIIYYAFGDIHLDTVGSANAIPSVQTTPKPTFGFLTKAGASPYFNASLSVMDSAMEIRYVRRSYPNIKLVLSVGGWGTVNSFNAIAASSELRKFFISSMISVVRQIGYDGLDISWEYPAKKDLQYATLLFSEIREQLNIEAQNSGKPRLIFTAAVTNTSIEGYNVAEMIKNLDLINIMAYDLHNPLMEPTETGHHSQLFPPLSNTSSTNVKDVVEGWEKAGAPKSKIVVGLATYGDTWNLTSPGSFGLGAPAAGHGPLGFYTRSPGYLAYYEICEKIRSGELLAITPPDIQTPYAHSANGKWWISYEDENSLRTKVRWVTGKGYGGIFVWDITFDDFFGNCGVKYPLLYAIKSELKV
ncbi:chitinase-3-like protein 1 [Paramacrobiotus metropolitanus]|uniref:chitinase-3-like protein 1 n=1 Tax=Paramacrobiotus metropolitanus TaxID=2943436 RepID=UPI0024460F0F|nr:chitinase-3-like protein 1 [Paramacrobiotus metropolitanus]